MTQLRIVQLFLGIYALAMLVFTLVWLLFEMRRTCRALRCTELPESGVTPPGMQVVFHVPGPTGDPETLSSARIHYQEIKRQHRVNKQRHLRRAQERWVSHGLMDTLR